MKTILRTVSGGAILTLVLLSAVPAHAEEEQKVKGVEVVPDTTVTVLQKINAFFTGNLTWTMPAGDSPYKNDYTVNSLGNRVPRSTLGKYDSGVR